jgi:hypothetical protein
LFAYSFKLFDKGGWFEGSRACFSHADGQFMLEIISPDDILDGIGFIPGLAEQLLQAFS